MLRAAFSHRNDGQALKLDGRLVGAWVVQVKSLLSRHFVSNGLLVDVSQATYVDSLGNSYFFGWATYTRSSLRKPVMRAVSAKGFLNCTKSGLGIP